MLICGIVIGIMVGCTGFMLTDVCSDASLWSIACKATVEEPGYYEFSDKRIKITVIETREWSKTDE